MGVSGVLGLSLAVGLIAVMFASQLIYKEDFKDGTIRDIYNYTENTLVWNSSRFVPEMIDNTSSITHYDFGNIQSVRIKNIIYRFADWLGYTTFEMGKWAMEFGYTHPEYDFEFYFNWCMKIVKYIIIILLISVITPLLLPLVATIYLIGLGVKTLILWFKKRKIERRGNK